MFHLWSRNKLTYIVAIVPMSKGTKKKSKLYHIFISIWFVRLRQLPHRNQLFECMYWPSAKSISDSVQLGNNCGQLA